MTEHPFDSAAREYDEIFTDPVPGRWFRNVVWEQVKTCFPSQSRVLDLGCGTGEDATWMASRGYRVTAMDVSSRMLETANEKATRLGVRDRIDFMQGDLSRIEIDGVHDGALSDFGAVNCVFDLEDLARRLASAIRKDGHVIFVVMGPCCPWEIVWYLLHGRVKEAFRRFRSSVDARVTENVTIRIWYPSPMRFHKEFSPYFRKVKTVGLGALVPPPYLDGLVRKGESFFRVLWKLEKALGSTFPLTWLNDHYLMVLRRV